MKRLAAIGAALAVMAVSALALLFTVGGGSLVTTHGSSMQPAFYAGDLAITRRGSGGYAVGDVATYRSEHMDTVVMHRIVAIDDGRYSLQGDNNSWLDPEQPLQDQLLGEVALRIPGGGIWLQRVTSPAALGATAFLVLISGGSVVTITRRQRRKRRRASAGKVAPTASQAIPAAWRIAFASAAVLAMGAGALGVATWTRPLSGPVTPATESSATLTFSYSAAVPPSPAYDGLLVTQPQPVFRRIADRVEVMFVYESAPAADVGGWTAAVQLETANGWRSTVAVPVAVAGSEQEQRGRIALELSELQARADAAARVISSDPAGDISVTVVPELRSAGQAFRPQLAFVMTSFALRLADTQVSALTVANPSAGPPVVTASGPSMLRLLGHALRVDHGRAAAAAGFALALAVAGVTAMFVRRARKAPETTTIEGRYGQILLSAQPMVLPVGRPVVDVVGFAALARLAERYGLLVLHWDRGGTSTYVVLDDSTTYRYRTAGSTTDERDDPAPPRLTAPGTTSSQLGSLLPPHRPKA